MTPQRTSKTAIISLILGLFSFILLALPSVFAIVLGHIARYRIKKSEGTLQGKDLALGGLICGYLSLLLMGLLIGGWLYNDYVDEQADITEIQRGKEIYTLVLKYENDHGQFPEKLSDLTEQGYIESLDDLQPIRGGHWVYFTGLNSQSSNSKYFIRSDENIIIRVDGSADKRELFFTLEPLDYPVEGHESIRE